MQEPRAVPRAEVPKLASHQTDGGLSFQSQLPSLRGTLRKSLYLPKPGLLASASTVEQMAGLSRAWCVGKVLRPGQARIFFMSLCDPFVPLFLSGWY